MIPFDFDYYKPTTIREALNLFQSLNQQGKKPIYYGGGTEFISMARMNNRYTEAVIDIKDIPECNVHELKNNELIIGSAVTLTRIAELNFFPLLSLTVQRIADHTIQGKITLGGNLAGTIIYKEAALPLLVSDSQVILSSINGERRVLVKDIYNNKIRINEGELIIQIIISESFLSLPYLHVKRTKNEKIDYPLITISTLKRDNKIRIAFSGLYDYPLRCTLVEDILNNDSIPLNKKMDKITSSLSDEILDDLSGSEEYRKFILSTMLSQILEKFEGVS